MSRRGDPAQQRRTPSIEAVVSGLSESGTLGLLGMTTEDLDAAEADSALFETLRITHELVGTLREEGVLATFLLLPEDDQANFVRWIGATDEERLRHDRTETFVVALRQAPLEDSTP